MKVQCLLVDVSQAMGKDLGIAKRKLQSEVNQQITQVPIKIKLGLVMMGSTDTQHGMKDEDDNLLEGWDNVCILKPIEQPDQLLIQAIDRLRIEEPQCSYISGLAVCFDMLFKEVSEEEEEENGKHDKSCVLVTNGKSLAEDDRHDIFSAISQKLIEQRIRLTVYGINFSADDDNQSSGEAMLRGLVRDTGGNLEIVSNEYTECRPTKSVDVGTKAEAAAGVPGDSTNFRDGSQPFAGGQTAGLSKLLPSNNSREAGGGEEGTAVASGQDAGISDGDMDEDDDRGDAVGGTVKDATSIMVEKAVCLST